MPPSLFLTLQQYSGGESLPWPSTRVSLPKLLLILTQIWREGCFLHHPRERGVRADADERKSGLFQVSTPFLYHLSKRGENGSAHTDVDMAGKPKNCAADNDNG